MSAGLIGNARTSKTTSPAPGAPTSGTSAHSTLSSGGPYRSRMICFMGRPPSRCELPAEPVADRAPHDELLVLLGQPGQLLGEHGHALLPRDRHPRDVGSPEQPLRAEGVVELPDVAVNVAIRVRLARVARRAGRLERHVAM